MRRPRSYAVQCRERRNVKADRDSALLVKLIEHFAHRDGLARSKFESGRFQQDSFERSAIGMRTGFCRDDRCRFGGLLTLARRFRFGSGPGLCAILVRVGSAARRGLEGVRKLLNSVTI